MLWKGRKTEKLWQPLYEQQKKKKTAVSDLYNIIWVATQILKKNQEQVKNISRTKYWF